MNKLLVGALLAVAFLLGRAMSAQGDGRVTTCEEDRDWLRKYITSVYDITIGVQDSRLAKLDKLLIEGDCDAILESPGLYWGISYRILGTQEVARIMDGKNKWKTAEWDRIDAAMEVRSNRMVDRHLACLQQPETKPAKKKAH